MHYNRKQIKSWRGLGGGVINLQKVPTVIMPTFAKKVEGAALYMFFPSYDAMPYIIFFLPEICCGIR